MKKSVISFSVVFFLGCVGSVYGAESEKEVFMKGVAYAQKGNYGAAAKSFSKAIVLKPDFAEAYHNRGLSTTWKGKRTKLLPISMQRSR